VLLSSWNGEKYIAEQIDSILNQTYNNVRLVVRDDGSSDNTLNILDGYAGDPRVSVTRGGNMGVWRSFLHMLAVAPDADYYMFSDQDDVWLPDKIKFAIEPLSALPDNVPAAYFCRLDVVTDTLSHIAYSPMYKKPLGLRTAIAGNVLTGAACMMNRAARELIVRHTPECVVMHDWWVYIVVAAFGKVVYDERPMLLYRQHANNQIGLKTSALAQSKRRIGKYRGGAFHKKISRQAKEFYTLYGDGLNAGDKKFLERFIKDKTLPQRIAYAVTCPAYRQNFIDNALLRALILTDHI